MELDWKRAWPPHGLIKRSEPTIVQQILIRREGIYSINNISCIDYHPPPQYISPRLIPSSYVSSLSAASTHASSPATSHPNGLNRRMERATAALPSPLKRPSMARDRASCNRGPTCDRDRVDETRKEERGRRPRESGKRGVRMRTGETENTRMSIVRAVSVDAM